MSKKKHGKKSALARRYGHLRHLAHTRYGHFSVHEATAGIRRFSDENPMVTSAAAGAALGAVAAGMTAGSAAAVGAVAGLAVNQALRK
jgi:hypothetical protein